MCIYIRFPEVSFEIEVFPCKIEIWETYNPGAIIKILACDSSSGSDVDSGKVRYCWKMCNFLSLRVRGGWSIVLEVKTPSDFGDLPDTKEEKITG